MTGLKTILTSALILLAAAPAWTAALPPCTPGRAGETILPVRSAQMTYCVSDFGWSDSWFFSGNLSTYSQALDVLSGDDAPNIRWDHASAGGVGPGLGWMTPSLDQGTLSPQLKASSWSVVQPLTYISGTSAAQSVIAHPDGLRITITTTVTNLRTDIRLDILNTTNPALNPIIFHDLRIGDYFNFHANGSTGLSGDPNAARNQTTTYLLPGTDPRCPAGSACVYGQGNTSLPSFIANGRMWGSAIVGGVVIPIDPNEWMVGPASSYGGAIPEIDRIWRRVELDNYDNPALGSSYGPRDSAGAFQWYLNALNPGQQISFVVSKELIEIPEAATWQLLLLGGAAFGVLRYRRRPS